MLANSYAKYIYEKYPVQDGSVNCLDRQVILGKNQLAFFFEGLLLPKLEKALFQVIAILDYEFRHPLKLQKELTHPAKTPIINVSKKNTSFPILSDNLDEIYFCLPNQIISPQDLPKEYISYLQKNPQFNRACEIVVCHNHQTPWIGNIDLEINPYNKEKNIPLDEILPYNIQNFNHECRMTLFLKKNQSILEAGRSLLNQGAHYCDNLAQIMNEEGIFTYYTSGHFRHTI